MVSSLRERGQKSERGSSIVEAAIITPVFLMILFGLLEFGLIARDELTTTNASRDGGRAASVYANDAHADYWILESVKQSIAPMGEDLIEYVVIFRIEDVGDEMNPQCHIQSVAATSDPLRPCNRYSQTELHLPLYEADDVTLSGYWGCDVNPARAVDDAWCARDRETSLSAGLDLIGVYVKTKHYYITGFFGDQRFVDDVTIIQIEPEEA